MKNRIIGALAMFALLNAPAMFAWMALDVTYWKAYVTAFATTMTVSVAFSIIEYLKVKIHGSKPNAKTV